MNKCVTYEGHYAGERISSLPPFVGTFVEYLSLSGEPLVRSGTGTKF